MLTLLTPCITFAHVAYPGDESYDSSYEHRHDDDGSSQYDDPDVLLPATYTPSRPRRHSSKLLHQRLQPQLASTRQQPAGMPAVDSTATQQANLAPQAASGQEPASTQGSKGGHSKRCSRRGRHYNKWRC